MTKAKASDNTSNNASANTKTAQASTSNLTPSSYGRRVWSSLYELALLFGINFVTALVVQIILSLLKIKLPNWGHSLVFFFAMGIYFVYCWTRAGQTLAQRTWKLKTVTLDGQKMSAARAWLRYTLSYLGLMPAFIIAWTQFHQHSHIPSAASTYTLAIGLAFINWLALLGTSLMHPEKIALHERLSKTRTIWVKS